MRSKTGLIIGGIIALFSIIILVGVLAWFIGSYNSLVKMENDVDGQWAQVENQYQRKIDLIPTLVATVDAYQEFEQGTLTNITALRTQWMAAGSVEEQVDLSNQLDNALRTVILTYENYPYLQSIVAVQELIIELEGTENRITVERMRYNEDVRDFNTKIKQFPTVFVANMFDFEERSYFSSDAAPEQP